MKLQAPRGTRDLLGTTARTYLAVEKAFAELAPLYGFEPIRTPMFEPTGTFKRSLGDSTDIVNKEMYTFEDRGGTSLTLRPEGTAPVVRAMVSNGLTREVPLKYFYMGSMFRFERPQKGRYREFFQLGAEALGPRDPIADAEVMALGHHLIQKLGLKDQVTLELNTLGDKESRELYKSQLVTYFSKVKNQLSEDSQRRLDTNPLRILDSKDEKDQKFLAGAPQFGEFMNSASESYFAQVQEGLSHFGVPFQINSRLVRGLDYYCDTVWEFTTQALGAQNAVLSGGRYDGLMENLGGPSLPGVGFGGGIDRMVLLLGESTKAETPVAVVAMSGEARSVAIETLGYLRQAGVSAQMYFSGNPAKQLKKAHKKNCWGALLIGEEELQTQTFTLKTFACGTQITIAKNDLLIHMKQRKKKEDFHG